MDFLDRPGSMLKLHLCLIGAKAHIKYDFPTRLNPSIQIDVHLNKCQDADKYICLKSDKKIKLDTTNLHIINLEEKLTELGETHINNSKMLYDELALLKLLKMFNKNNEVFYTLDLQKKSTKSFEYTLSIRIDIFGLDKKMSTIISNHVFELTSLIIKYTTKPSNMILKFNSSINKNKELVDELIQKIRIVNGKIRGIKLQDCELLPKMIDVAKQLAKCKSKQANYYLDWSRLISEQICDNPKTSIGSHLIKKDWEEHKKYLK